MLLSSLVAFELYSDPGIVDGFENLPTIDNNDHFQELIADARDANTALKHKDDSKAANTIQNGTDCGEGPRPLRLSFRHIESNGIGYEQGYSTVEGFFAPFSPLKDAWLPFLDVRGHIFNHGKLAANAGLGLRYLTSRVWGVNAYYDYRNAKHQHYNQISMGFETLGKTWDFRINGYLPVGAKTSPFYHTKFEEFEGHHMIISRKREFAMKGANAEVGAHVDNIKNVPFYFAAGPYYLTGQGRTAWGGELRAVVDLYEHVRLEGNTSYDKVFKWIGQGQVSINFPLGAKRKIKQRKKYSCSQEVLVRERSLQRVDRNEIIPVSHRRKKTTAINPATGQPWFFWFVNNTSHSDGTFESPFNTLVAAQNASAPNDVIYVFPGDGTSTGLSQGITLQNDQKLFGSSTEQSLATTFGTIEIPAFTNILPQLVTGANVSVTLANGNEVSGLHLSNTAFAAVLGSGINNTYIHDNSFTSNVVNLATQIIGSGSIVFQNNQFINTSGTGAFPFPEGIRLITSAGQMITGIISGNTFSGFTFAIGMNLNNDGTADYTIQSNMFSNGLDGGTGIFWGTSGGTPGSYRAFIIDNTFDNMPNQAIGVFGMGTQSCVTIDSNRMNNIRGSTAIAVVAEFNTGPFTANILKNIVTNSPTPVIEAITVGATQICVNLTDNNVTSAGTYPLSNPAGTFTLAPLSGNTGTVVETGTITPVIFCPCSGP